MSDKYFEEKRSTHLTQWVTGQMLKGAAWAAAFVLAIGLGLAVIYGIGLLLPAESKQAPSPYGALEQAAITAVA